MKRDLPFVKAREGFRFHNQTSNRSKRTIDWYDSNLRIFQEFMRERKPERPVDNLGLSEITAEDIREFIAHLQGRTSRYASHYRMQEREGGLSPYTIQGFVRALSAFFAWAVREEYLPRSPMANIKRPQVPKSIKEIFSQDEIKRLLKACDDYPQPLAARNRAIVKFLLDTGVRAGELCELTEDRIDERMRRVHVTGKGMKDRYVVLSESTGQALWKYINFYRPPERGKKTGRVFLTHRGGALKPVELERMLRNLGERAQVEHVHPHRFRHTAGTLFYRNSNGNLFLTQQMLGHESPVTTRIYAKTYTEDLERVHENASPVSNWEL